MRFSLALAAVGRIIPDLAEQPLAPLEVPAPRPTPEYRPPQQGEVQEREAEVLAALRDYLRKRGVLNPRQPKGGFWWHLGELLPRKGLVPFLRRHPQEFGWTFDSGGKLHEVTLAPAGQPLAPAGPACGPRAKLLPAPRAAFGATASPLAALPPPPAKAQPTGGPPPAQARAAAPEVDFWDSPAQSFYSLPRPPRYQ